LVDIQPRVRNAPPHRIIAIDWSGDHTVAGQRKKIYLADSSGPRITLTAGRTRQEVAHYLISAARESPQLVVGLDFAFSFPAWFVRQQNCNTAEQFWALLASGVGEQWLVGPNLFCWGRKGRRCPANHRGPGWKGFRRTDREISVGGIQPKSPFQIGGAGAVGTGSLRGIPVLHQLLTAGFHIWPFTPPGFPLALEIYPRLFTGKGNKSSEVFRARHLAQPEFASLKEEVLAPARQSEDAFDALCTVLVMRDHAGEFAAMKQEQDADLRLEGRIWQPSP
jgi:hypothetical protein